MRLGAQTIVVVRAGTDDTDAWGNPVEGWDDPTETTVSGCSVQPDAGLEFINGQQAVEDLWKVWAPPTTDVVPTDRVEYAGVTYDVNGEIQRWDFPPLAHVAFRMRRVESQ